MEAENTRFLTAVLGKEGQELRACGTMNGALQHNEHCSPGDVDRTSNGLSARILEATERLVVEESVCHTGL